MSVIRGAVVDELILLALMSCKCAAGRFVFLFRTMNDVASAVWVTINQ